MPQPRGWSKGGRLLRGAAGPAIGFVAGLMGIALPAAAQTLTEAFAYAYNNNPQLLAQRAALRATDETVPQALANWRPTVTFNAQAGFNRTGFGPGVNATANDNCAGPAGTTCATQFSSFTPRSMQVQAN